MDYTSQSESLDLVKDRIGVNDNSLDSVLTTLLELTKANNTYRPYYVAGLQLEQSLQEQRLSKAGEATFSGLGKTIYSLFKLQASTDQALDLDVPAGFSATEKLDHMDYNPYSTSKSKPKVKPSVQSRSVRVKTQF